MKFPLRFAFVFPILACATHVRAQDALPAATPYVLPEPANVVHPPHNLPNERVQPLNRRAETRPQPRNAEAQRKEAKRQAELEGSVRAAMTANGFGETVLQDAILAHVVREARARKPLRDRARRLFRTMQKPGDTQADKAMNKALDDYLTALETDRARRIAEETALDKTIGWTKNPRLHAMLLLFGVIGESAVTLPLRTFTDERPNRQRDAEAAPSAPKPPAETTVPPPPEPPAEVDPAEVRPVENVAPDYQDGETAND